MALHKSSSSARSCRVVSHDPTALLHTSARILPVSMLSGSIRLLRGRPGRRFQSRLGGRPDARSTCNFWTSWAGTLSESCAMCQKRDWWRRAIMSTRSRWPVRAVTAAFVRDVVTPADASDSALTFHMERLQPLISCCYRSWVCSIQEYWYHKGLISRFTNALLLLWSPALAIARARLPLYFTHNFIHQIHGR